MNEAAILAEVRRICAEEIGVERVIEEAHRLDEDLELDSVQILVLVVGLEDHFHVILEEDDATAVRTVGDLVRLVARRQGSVAARPNLAQVQGGSPHEGELGPISEMPELFHRAGKGDRR